MIPAAPEQVIKFIGYQFHDFWTSARFRHIVWSRRGGQTKHASAFNFQHLQTFNWILHQKTYGTISQILARASQKSNLFHGPCSIDTNLIKTAFCRRPHVINAQTTGDNY